MQEQQYSNENINSVTQDTTMDVRYIFFLLMQKWWIIAVSALLCGIIAALISQFYLKSEYASTTSLFVYRKTESDSALLTELNVGSQLVKDSVVLLKSDVVMSRAITVSGAKRLSASSLAANTVVTAEKDTRIIRITVTNGDKVMAASLANAVADSFLEVFKNLTQSSSRYAGGNDEFINVIDKAYPVNTPVRPNKRMNVVLGLFAGAAIGAAIIFLMEFLDDTIKSPELLKLQYNIDVLGVIPVFELKKNEGSNA